MKNSIRRTSLVSVGTESKEFSSSIESTSSLESYFSDEASRICLPIAPGFKSNYRALLKKTKEAQKRRNAYTAVVKPRPSIEEEVGTPLWTKTNHHRRSHTSRHREAL